MLPGQLGARGCSGLRAPVVEDAILTLRIEQLIEDAIVIDDGLGLAIRLQRTDHRFACVKHGIVVENRKVGFDRHTGNATRARAQTPHAGNRFRPLADLPVKFPATLTSRTEGVKFHNDRHVREIAGVVHHLKDLSGHRSIVHLADPHWRRSSVLAVRIGNKDYDVGVLAGIEAPAHRDHTFAACCVPDLGELRCMISARVLETTPAVAAPAHHHSHPIAWHHAASSLLLLRHLSSALRRSSCLLPGQA